MKIVMHNSKVQVVLWHLRIDVESPHLFNFRTFYWVLLFVSATCIVHFSKVGTYSLHRFFIFNVAE
jgi:hypothetical protein